MQNSKRIKDTIWNTLGAGSFAAISFILLTITTRIYGIAIASTVGISITTAQLLFRVGLFSTAQYQVTDKNEKFSFSDYFSAKTLSTLLCFFLCFVYLIFDKKIKSFFIPFLFIFLLYQLISFDDLYLNRLYQRGKLDLSGRRKFIVIISFLISFTVNSIFKLNINYSLFISLSISILFSILFCFNTETVRINKNTVKQGLSILFMCIPAFISNLLFAAINSMPKYTTFYLKTREESGYINDIFILLNIIELIGTFIYYPFISDITDNMRDNRRKAKKIILKVGICIISVAFITTVFTFFWGATLLSIFYGIDFSDFVFEITYTVGICGTLIALIAFLYWIPIILRDQKSLILIFILGFIISIISSIIGAFQYGISAIIIGYSVGIGIIAILLFIYFLVKVRKY